MARAKKEMVDLTNDELVVDNVAEQEETDPWKRMVTVKLPKPATGEENFQFVGVNGRFFKVKKGEKVDVPEPVAEVLQNSYEQAESADEFISSLAK